MSRRAQTWWALASVGAIACTPAPSSGSGDGDSTGADTTAASAAVTTGPTPTTSTDDGADTSSGGDEGSTAAASTDGGTTGGAAESSSDSTTGAVAGCDYDVVLFGYWPPTNEMLRRFSTNPAQNPGTWEGEDWEGYGFDVYAFFPEFPPDGDPSNDPIGSPGSVGAVGSDLQVDYQDTSADFWAIVDELQPVIVISTSRGGTIGWEIEAIEGGHDGGSSDPAEDWYSDGYGDETLPTESSVDPRTWDAISSFRAGVTIGSTLPLQEIADATEALALTSVQVEYGTSGNYLSGFLGLHSAYYASITDYAVAGGHIHVANGLPTETAETLLLETLRTVLAQHPTRGLSCPPR